MIYGSTVVSKLDSRAFRVWLAASALAHLALAVLLALQQLPALEPDLSPVYVSVLTSLPTAPQPAPVIPPAPVEPVAIPPQAPPEPAPAMARLPVPLPPPEPILSAPPAASPRPAPAVPPPPDTRPLFPSSPAPLGRHTPPETAARLERADAPRRRPSTAKLPGLIAVAASVPVPEETEPLRVDRVRAPAPALRAPLRVPAAAAPVVAPEQQSTPPLARVARAARREPLPPERPSVPRAAQALPPVPVLQASRPRAAPLRTAAPTAASASPRAARPEQAIRGVPLDSLAACVADADEERWKRRVLAAVGSRETCTSAAGRYRFVETKNLNAFLMWIERASQRPAGDRCDELGLALECLKTSSGNGREAR